MAAISQTCQDVYPLAARWHHRRVVPAKFWDNCLQPFPLPIQPRDPQSHTRPCGSDISDPNSQPSFLCTWNGGCTTRICLACRDRNRTNFSRLLDAVWLNVCAHCRLNKRWVVPERRCRCMLNEQNHHIAAQRVQPWNYCERHTEMKWARVLSSAAFEIQRRRSIVYHHPQRVLRTPGRRRKPCLTLAGARRRQQADQARLALPSSVTYQSPSQLSAAVPAALGQPALPQGHIVSTIPVCECGRPVQAPGMRANNANAHHRTGKRGEVRNCAGCRTLYDFVILPPGGPVIPRGNVGPAHDRARLLTVLLNDGNSTGWVTRR